MKYGYFNFHLNSVLHNENPNVELFNSFAELKLSANSADPPVLQLNQVGLDCLNLCFFDSSCTQTTV